MTAADPTTLLAELDHVGVVAIDRRGRVHCDPVAARCTHFGDGAAYDDMVAATAPSVAELWRAVREDGHWRGSIETPGEDLVARAVVVPQDDEMSLLVLLVAETSHVDDWRHVVDAALHDPLTGASSRALLDEHLSHAAARLERGAGPLAVLFVDVDGLKTINDQQGHAAGDQAIVHVARCLRAAVRPADSIGRFGGDEFVVVCEEVAGDAAASIAERIVTAIAAAPVEPDLARVTVSVGVAVSGHGAVDTETLLHRADRAMYRAKRAGGNRWEQAPDPADEAHPA